MKDKFINFFSKKDNIIFLIVLILIILVTVVVILVTTSKKNKFTLNNYYDQYPQIVRELYSNVVSVSCYGDLYLDLELDGEIKKINDISLENKIDYMFSYLDKNNKLVDNFEISELIVASAKLFNDNFDFRDKINNYIYGDYAYTLSNGKVTRKEAECKSSKKYVSLLYSFFYNEDNTKLSMIVNMGYLIDDVLYNLSGNSLGKYSDDISKLNELLKDSSYYQYNYVKDGSSFKLDSVEWKNRILFD